MPPTWYRRLCLRRSYQGRHHWRVYLCVVIFCKNLNIWIFYKKAVLSGTFLTNGKNKQRINNVFVRDLLLPWLFVWISCRETTYHLYEMPLIISVDTWPSPRLYTKLVFLIWISMIDVAVSKQATEPRFYCGKVRKLYGRNCDLLIVTEYLFHRRQRIVSVCRGHRQYRTSYPVLDLSSDC